MIGGKGAVSWLKKAVIRAVLHLAEEDTTTDGRRTRRALGCLQKAVEGAAKENSIRDAVYAATQQLRGEVILGLGDSLNLDARGAMDKSLKEQESKHQGCADLLSLATRIMEALDHLRQEGKWQDKEARAKGIDEVAGDWRTGVPAEVEINELLRMNDGGQYMADALVYLAKLNVSPRMGEDYTNVVIRCLKYLKVGLGRQPWH
jgi:hypothetical protein